VVLLHSQNIEDRRQVIDDTLVELIEERDGNILLAEERADHSFLLAESNKGNYEISKHHFLELQKELML
jgi:hypothetical protein